MGNLIKSFYIVDHPFQAELMESALDCGLNFTSSWQQERMEIIVKGQENNIKEFYSRLAEKYKLSTLRDYVDKEPEWLTENPHQQMLTYLSGFYRTVNQMARRK